MKISFRKTSSTHHELVVGRADGSVDRMNCETGAGQRITEHQSHALLFAEQLVSVLTGATRADDFAAAAEHARDYLQQVGASVPDDLAAEFVANVAERLRRLRGHWRATAFGDVMEISWPLRC